MNFIQLTDLHLQADDEEKTLGVDTQERSYSALDQIEQGTVKPEFFVITGDLANNGEVGAYVKLQAFIGEIQKRFDVPVYTILGNHDKREPFTKVTGIQANPKYYYSEDIDNSRLIFMDSKSEEGNSKGSFGHAQLAWLKDQLDGLGEKRAILLFHHPVITTPLELMDGLDFEEDDALKFRELVKNYSNVAAVFNGHAHFTVFGDMDGVPSIISSATAFGLDAHAGMKMRVMDEGGYMIVTLRNDQVIVSPQKLAYSGEEIFLFDPSKDKVDMLIEKFAIKQELHS